MPTPKKVRSLNLSLVDTVLRPFLQELARRGPEALAEARSRGQVPALYEYDIRVNGRTFWQAYDEAQEAMARLPPVAVRVGDRVRIGERVLLVTAVNHEERRVHTERRGSDGARISGGWCDAEYPDGSPLELARDVDPVESDWPTVPETIRDGLGRARFQLRQHELLLVRAGLASDSD